MYKKRKTKQGIMAFQKQKTYRQSPNMMSNRKETHIHNPCSDIIAYIKNKKQDSKHKKWHTRANEGTTHHAYWKHNNAQHEEGANYDSGAKRKTIPCQDS